MKILGLIPARGGSKGVPRKNIKLLLGKPLIAYTIEQALSSLLLNQVILSTDDHEIASIAKDYGLEVPFMRPEELATDEATTFDVVKHTLDYFQSEGKIFDAVCILQVTSPYRPSGSIDESINAFIKSKPDSLISVRKIPDEYNPQWAFKMSHNNRLETFSDEKEIISRRQDLPIYYHRDGAIYITLIDTIKNKGSLLGETILSYPIDSPKLINIDTEEDWDEAERFFKTLL